MSRSDFAENPARERRDRTTATARYEQKKQAIVAANAEKRQALKAQIAKLEAERTKFVAEEQKKQGVTGKPSLETELMKSTKKVATKKGYKP